MAPGGHLLSRVHSDSNLNMSETNGNGFEAMCYNQQVPANRCSVNGSINKPVVVNNNNLTSVSYSQIMDNKSSPVMGHHGLQQAYQPKYKKASNNYDYTDQIHHPTGFNGVQQSSSNDWKKYATYSANPLKNLTNVLVAMADSSTTTPIPT